MVDTFPLLHQSYRYTVWIAGPLAKHLVKQFCLLFQTLPILINNLLARKISHNRNFNRTLMKKGQNDALKYEIFN